MHKRIGKGLSVLLLLLGISCISAFAGSAVIGSVAGSMNATVSGRPLIPNATVFSGDNLKVADGATVIALGDGSRLMFGRDTQATFLRNGDQVTIQLQQGKVSVYHAGANSGLRIQVNNIVIQPEKGFTTMGQVAALNGAIAVTSTQGMLRIDGNGQSQQVPQGRTITIRQLAGRAPQAAGGSQKFAGGGGSTLLEAGALGAGVVAAILAGIGLSRANDAKTEATAAASEATIAASNAAAATSAANAADSDALAAETTANAAGCAVNNLNVQFGFPAMPSPYTPPSSSQTCGAFTPAI
jgi:phosphohistidine swiveling domain-containing protein